MDAHINNRETFLTDAQFLNRLSKRVRLRFVVEINGDLQRSKLVTRWSFFFHLFSLFPSFLSPFLSFLSARFFFLFLRDRPHNYATLNVEPDRFAFQTDHLPFFRSDFAAHLVARFEGKRVPPLSSDFIEMDSKFLLILSR